MLRKNTLHRLGLVLAAVLVTTTTSFAQSCSFNSNLVVVNNTGKVLKSVGVVHRYGKSGGSVEVRYWNNVAPGTTNSQIVRGQGGGLTGLIPNWWTVVFTDEEQGMETTFQLNPYNFFVREWENMQSALLGFVQSTAATGFKNILGTSPETALVDPVVKVAVAFLAGDSKAPSVSRYKVAQLHCRDAGKTMKIVIGGSTPTSQNTIGLFPPSGRQVPNIPYGEILADLDIKKQIRDGLQPKSASGDKSANDQGPGGGQDQGNTTKSTATPAPSKQKK